MPEKKVKAHFTANKQNPAAVKIHKDGRLFVCYLGDFESSGGIYAVDANGEQQQMIISDIETEYCVDDLVFDSKGGFILLILGLFDKSKRWRLLRRS